MPLYIAQSGDLDRCYRCLTDSLTHSQRKDSATQLLINCKSGALVTQYRATQLVSSIKHKLSHAIVCDWAGDCQQCSKIIPCFSPLRNSRTGPSCNSRLQSTAATRKILLMRKSKRLKFFSSQKIVLPKNFTHSNLMFPSSSKVPMPVEPWEI